MAVSAVSRISHKAPVRLRPSLGSGLIGAWVFNNSAHGYYQKDLSRRCRLGKTSTSTSSYLVDYRSTQKGLSVYSGSTSNGWKIEVPPAKSLDLTTELSFVSWVIPLAVDVGNTVILSSRSSNISIAGYEWGIRAGTLAFAYNDGGIQGWYTDTSGSVSIGGIYVLGATWRQGAVRFFIDGRFTSQVATSSGTIVNAAADPYLIGHQSSNSSFYGYYLAHFAWNRKLSDEEMLAVALDPKRILSQDVQFDTTVYNAQETGGANLGFGSFAGASLSDIPKVPASGTSVTPSAAELNLSATAPAVVLGSVSVTPAAAVVALSSTAPTVVLGALSLTPAASVVQFSAIAPAISLGGVLVTPAAAVFNLSSVAPSVVLGDVISTPAAAEVQLSSTAPTVSLGGVSIQPAAAEVSLSAEIGGVVLGSVSIQPASAEVELSASIGGVLVGDIVVQPPSAEVSLTSDVAGVVLGSVAVAPSAAELELSSSIGSIVQGSIMVTPSAAVFSLQATDPTLTGLGVPWVYGLMRLQSL